MKTNVQLKIERDLNEQLYKLTKITCKTTYTKSKIKALHMILDIVAGNTPNIELLVSIEEKFLFFANAYNVVDELIDEIEAGELKDYETKNAEEIINKLNLEVK